MIIRLLKSNDYDDIYTLWLSTPNMGLNDIDDTREGIVKYLKRNPNTCFVAEKNGCIIGVILSGHDGRRGFIYHTAVAADEQQQGIGSALVDAAMTALEREGISKVALVAMSKNDKGNAFWEKQRFITRPDLVYRNKAITEMKAIDT